MRFTTRNLLYLTTIAALALALIAKHVEGLRKDEVIQEERWRAFTWMKRAERLAPLSDRSEE